MRQLITIFAIIFSLIIQCQTDESFLAVTDDPTKFQKVTLDQSTGAACLDGSAPTFYFRKGSGTGANNFIIYFEGGGWCYGPTLNDTLQDCYNRAQQELGSSKNDEPELTFDGLLSANSTTNPKFYNWNMAFIRYCDGTGHQGYKKDPVEFNNTKLYFRGTINTKQMLDMLQTTYNMGSPDLLLVSGDSAGGLATFNWVNYISGLFKDKTTKIFGAPDSGLFLDYIDVQTNTYLYAQEFVNFMTFSNAEIDPINSQCVNDYPTEKWKCMFAQYLVNYITVPMFFIESEYDQWSLQNIMGEYCIYDQTTKQWCLDGCTTDQVQAITGYQQATVGNITSQIKKHQGVWSAWMPSCIFHVATLDNTRFNSASYNVPMNSNNTLNYALTTWMNAVINNEVVSTYIDTVSWPNNKPCAYLG